MKKLICTAFVAIFFALGFAIKDTRTNVVLRLDTAVQHFALTHQILPTFWTIITQFGGAIILSLVFVATIFLIRDKRHAIFFVSITVVAFAADVIGKAFYARARPDRAVMDSFPSGHTLMSTAIYGTILVLVWRMKPSTSRTIALWILPSLIVLIGISRIMINVHWLSDVVAGLCLGTGIIIAALAIQEITLKKEKIRKK